MKKKKIVKQDVFTRFFNFIMDNGYTKVTYPESWNIIKKK